MSENWVCSDCSVFNHPRRSQCWHCGALRSSPGSQANSYFDTQWKRAIYAKLRAWGVVELDPGIDAVIELDTAEAAKVTWQARLRLFGGSLLAFLIVGWLLTLGMDSYSVLDLLILVFAVFLHEIGHYLGMHRFGYQNLRMFFIPLFGAAVSGHGVQVTVVEEAVVFLLGPMPGLLIGYICGILYIVTHVAVWRQFAVVFVLLNGINLLPMYPLDGGQFVFTVLSGRSARVDTLLQVSLTLLLVGMGIFLGWGSFIWLGLSLTFRVWRLLKINKIVHQLRASNIISGAQQDEAIPASAASSIIDALQKELPELSDSKQVAENVVSIWRRANAKRPSLKEAVSLLFVYAVGLVTFGVARFVYLTMIAN